MYEYKSEMFKITGSDLSDAKMNASMSEMMDFVNTYAKDGWRLIKVLKFAQDSNRLDLLFERKI